MTAQEWLRDRMEFVPTSLAGALTDALISDVASDKSIAAQLAVAGREQLAELLASGDESRAVALKLLTADSLITFACEAACDNPASLEENSARWIADLSHLLEGAE